MEKTPFGQPLSSLRRAATATFATATTKARLAVLLAPALLAACAQIPASTVTESEFGTLTCAQLAEQIEAAKATMAAADQAKGNSWHAVLPFIVAARYGQASSAASEAERRLTLLAEQSARLGCAQ
jgi:2-oxo-4-hydroxy-4-carboxy--5-ureidoimidazoline (OHCU) decarboxylase